MERKSSTEQDQMLRDMAESATYGHGFLDVACELSVLTKKARGCARVRKYCIGLVGQGLHATHHDELLSSVLRVVRQTSRGMLATSWGGRYRRIFPLRTQWCPHL